MPTVDQLLIKIEADTALMRRELAKAEKGVDSFDKRTARAMRNTESELRRVERRFGSLRGVVVGVASALAAREFTQAVNVYQQMEGQLRLVTKSADELKRVQGTLFQQAQRNRTEFSATVDLYARLARWASLASA